SPEAIRLPAFLAGAACIPMTFALGRQFHDDRAALFAAGLVATSSILVEYSTNARGYILQCLIVLVLLSCTVRLQQDGLKLGAWHRYIIASIVGLYVLPTTIYAVAAMVLWMALTGRHQRNRFLLTMGL